MRRVAELLEEPRSTVYRLCSSLQELGYIEAGVQRGTYRLSLKLLHLGSTVLDRFDERASALPVMQRLHDETGETVFLCVRRGLEAVWIERIDRARVMLLELRLGGSLPLHLGAAPRCLPAFEPESSWRAYHDAISLEPVLRHTRARRRERLDYAGQRHALGAPERLQMHRTHAAGPDEGDDSRLRGHGRAGTRGCGADPPPAGWGCPGPGARPAPEIAEERRVWLFDDVAPSVVPHVSKVELSIGEPALEISPEEAAELFQMVVSA